MNEEEVSKNLEAVRDIPDLAALEHATTAGKIAVGLLPVVGGTLSEILGKNTSIVVGAREKKWKQAVVSALEELFEKAEGKIDPEEFLTDDRFVTALLNATQIATRTHQQEKWDALRNAVLNSALPNAPEDDLQLIFLHFIDDLTAWHLRLLKFFDNPEKWEQDYNRKLTRPYMGSLSQILEEAFPELKGKRDLYDQLAKDLTDRGLADLGSSTLHTSMSGHGIFSSRTRPLGREFLKFIESPI